MFHQEYHLGKLSGLPDIRVRESKERVKTAIKNSGYELLSRKIVVNLAPADTKKEGSFFDLPIAIGILTCLGELNQNKLEQIAFLGELSLDGTLNQINGILPMCIEAQKLGIKKLIVPKENAKEAAIVKGIEIIGAQNLYQVVEYLNSRIEIIPHKITIEELYKNKQENIFDFSEVFSSTLELISFLYSCNFFLTDCFSSNLVPSISEKFLFFKEGFDRGLFSVFAKLGFNILFSPVNVFLLFFSIAKSFSVFVCCAIFFC